MATRSQRAYAARQAQYAQLDVILDRRAVAQRKANRAVYRTRVLQACPAWVDQGDLNAIYAHCPAGYHVDHIHPLKGELSSGLHVPWNLQYLPALVNIAKGNRYVDVSMHAIDPKTFIPQNRSAF